MNEKQLREEINKTKKDIDDNKLKLRELKHELNALLCPFKVKDIIVNKHGMRAVVTSVDVFSENGAGICSIKKIKKDGTFYKVTTPAFKYEEWKLEK